MITKVEVENFKAFGTAQSLVIKPITLLFGPNSAGKSSFIHAILLMRHALENGDFSPESTQMGEVDLGGFRSFVYRHDLNKRVRLGFSIEQDRISEERDFTISYGVEYNEENESSYLSSIEFFVDSCMRFNFERKSKSLRAGSLDLSFAKIIDDGMHIETDRLSRLPMRLIMILLKRRLSKAFETENDLVIDKILTFLVSQFVRINISDILGAADKNIYGISMPSRILNKLLLNDRSLYENELETLETTSISTLIRYTQYVKKLIRYLSANMEFSELRIVKDEELKRVIENISDIDKEVLQNLPIGTTERIVTSLGGMLSAVDLISSNINWWLTTMNLRLKKALERLSYLGPFRHYPERGGFEVIRSSANVDPYGKFAWGLLHKDSVSLKMINNWLGREKMDTKYELVVREFYDDEQIDTVKKNGGTLDDLQSQRPSSRTLQIIDRNYKIPVSHRDIGVGISQVVPVLASAYGLENKIIAIEQPEIHLHPKLQSELADVFIENRMKNIFILETHSEHLILRLLRRVREKESIGEIPAITHEDISVVYVRPTSNGSHVTSIGITENGDFSAPWPSGFFEERFEELE